MSDLQQKFNALLKVNEQLLEANKELAAAKKYADLAAQAEAQELNRANQRIKELLAKQLTPLMKARREMFRFPKDTTAALIESTELVMKLQAENAALKEKLEKAKAMPMKYRSMEFNAQLQQEADSLREQLAAAQKDAARYRQFHKAIMGWRSGHDVFGKLFMDDAWLIEQHRKVTQGDAAIDAAIRAEQAPCDSIEKGKSCTNN